MTTEAQHILTLDRLLDDAEEAALDAERDLAAALLDLDAAHRREADLAAELIQARRAIAEQAEMIEVMQHAAVLAYHEQQRLQAEIDRLKGEHRTVVLVFPPALGRCPN